MTPAKILFSAALVALFAVPTLAVAEDAETANEATTQAVPDTVTTAEVAVAAARDALEKAIGAGDGVDVARENLRKALQDLDDARQMAGLPLLPPNPADALLLVPPPAAPGAEPPPEVTAPPADNAGAVPPPDPNAPPMDQPVADQPPSAAPEAPAVVVTEQPPAPPPPDQQPPPPDQPAPPAPAPGVEEPPPAPPPAATLPTFDLDKFRDRPKFGELPPTLPDALPPSADAITEGATVVTPGGRTIAKRGGQIVIDHDDLNRVRQQGDNVTSVDNANGTTTETIQRRNGTLIVTVRDRDNNIIQRYRQSANGRIVPLIGPPPQSEGGVATAEPPPPPPPPSFDLNLGPLQLTIPEGQYIVDSNKANTKQLEGALAAAPVETVERAYTLDEVRNSDRLRDKVRRVDFNTITFDTGQATVPDDQIGRMQSLGTALRAIIDRDPSQVFLIEGHTDAIGSDLYNLALSDRRAETVAEILSYYFGIPAENLVTQGYGEQFLKVPTLDANRENRRVAFRNITDLLHAPE